jgi:hypothetical protein
MTAMTTRISLPANFFLLPLLNRFLYLPPRHFLRNANLLRKRGRFWVLRSFPLRRSLGKGNMILKQKRKRVLITNSEITTGIHHVLVPILLFLGLKLGTLILRITILTLHGNEKDIMATGGLLSIRKKVLAQVLTKVTFKSCLSERTQHYCLPLRVFPLDSTSRSLLFPILPLQGKILARRIVRDPKVRGVLIRVSSGPKVLRNSRRAVTKGKTGVLRETKVTRTVLPTTPIVLGVGYLLLLAFQIVGERRIARNPGIRDPHDLRLINKMIALAMLAFSGTLIALETTPTGGIQDPMTLHFRNTYVARRRSFKRVATKR